MNWICLLYAGTVLKGVTVSFGYARAWRQQHWGHWSKWLNRKTGESYPDYDSEKGRGK